MNDPDEIRRLLDEATLWFVVGLGNSPERTAYGVAAALQARGKRIVPIHPRAEVVHGEQGYATIAEAAAAVGTPDVVRDYLERFAVHAGADELMVVHQASSVANRMRSLGTLAEAWDLSPVNA